MMTGICRVIGVRAEGVPIVLVTAEAEQQGRGVHFYTLCLQKCLNMSNMFKRKKERVREQVFGLVVKTLNAHLGLPGFKSHLCS